MPHQASTATLLKLLIFGAYFNFRASPILPPIMTSYDCSIPSVTKSYSILNAESCEHLKFRLKKSNQIHMAKNGRAFLIVLQKKQFIQMEMQSCYVQSKASMDYCGISAIHHLIDEVTWTTREINAKDCRILWEGGSIKMDDHHIKGKPNKEHLYTYNVGAGHTQDGNCGDLNTDQKYNDKVYDDAIGTIGYKIRLEKITVAFDLGATSMVMPYEAPCNIKRTSYCEVDNFIFLKPTNLHQNTFCLWAQTAMTRFDIHSTRDTRNDDHTIKPNDLLLAPHKLMAFYVQNNINQCDTTIFVTTYENLALARAGTGVPFQSIDKSEISPFLYTKTLVSFTLRRSAKLFNDLTYQVSMEVCKNKVSLIRQRLETLSLNEGKTVVVKDRPRIFGRVAGASIYFFKCAPIQIKFRQPRNCTDDLPVTVVSGPTKGAHMCTDPVTKILSTCVETPCNTILQPTFQADNDNWVQYGLRVTTINKLPPFPLDFDFHNVTWNHPKSMKDTGIYSDDDIANYQKSFFLDKQRMRVSVMLSDHSSVKQGRVYLSQGVFPDIDGIWETHFGWIGRIIDKGGLWTGRFIFVALIYQVINFLVNRIILFLGMRPKERKLSTLLCCFTPCFKSTLSNQNKTILLRRIRRRRRVQSMPNQNTDSESSYTDSDRHVKDDQFIKQSKTCLYPLPKLRSPFKKYVSRFHRTNTNMTPTTTQSTTPPKPLYTSTISNTAYPNDLQLPLLDRTNVSLDPTTIAPQEHSYHPDDSECPVYVFPYTTTITSESIPPPLNMTPTMTATRIPTLGQSL